MNPADPCAKPGLQTVETLQALLLEGLSTPGTEQIAVADALGRTLAAPIMASVANPRFDNSAMDGFALGAQVVARAPGDCALDGVQLAGGEMPSQLDVQSARRITTGARVPGGTAAVVMQEDCSWTDTRLNIHKPVSAGANIRRAGEDIRTGQLLLEAGCRLQPRHLMLLASQGLRQVEVHRRPRVALLSSGDELRAPGAPLGDSGIHDCNRPYLQARLQAAGVEVVDLGIVADEPRATHEALQRAAAGADLIVSSGGVSVGEADWLKQSVESLGELLHWRVNLKPGKPVAWGRVGSTPFLGLPGNPVSTLVCGELFLLPAVRRLSGQAMTLPRFIRLPLAEGLRRKPGREEYMRVRLTSADGDPLVQILPGQGSGALGNLGQTDGLVRLQAEHDHLEAGTLVDILLLGD